jgi:hypothetical protein
MRIRPVVLVAAAGVVATVAPAHAAGPKPQVVDAIGDANGVNQQIPGVGPEPPTVQTAPADLSGADISTVQFVTNFVTKKVKNKKVKVADGFTVTLTLAAAPTPNVEYRVSAAAGKCKSVFFEYDTSIALGSSDVRCPGTTPTDDTDYGVTATASGTKISWVVPGGVFRTGTVFSSLNAQTRMVEGVVTAPQIDFASSAATYTLGK